MKTGKRIGRLLRTLKRSRPQPLSPRRPEQIPPGQKLLAGRTVLVTGGAGTVGRGIAIEAAVQGANVVVVDIDDEARAALEKEVASYPGWVKGFHCDMSRVEEIDRLCGSLQDDNISIDVLVNNVGVQFRTHSIRDFDIDEWHKAFEVNVFGPMHLTRCIARSMIEADRQGSILFVTSIHQWVIRRYASYSASKGALGMIVKELAVELAQYGIRVNGIAPGWVAEDAAGYPLPQRVAPLHETSIPPCYIGRAVVYLASDHYSLHTTGTVLKIDAGLSLANYLTQRQ